MKIPSIAVLAALFSAAVASASTLTNSDVIKMSDAKLEESVIIKAIENSQPQFDVSTQGLIDLSNAKVPPAVIKAMIGRSSTATSSVPPPPPAPGAQAASDLMSPSDVLMVDGSEIRPMRYLTPQVRTAARGLGFGGFATYASLYGTAAGSRTKNARPSFLVSVPSQAQPQSYITLANLAVRRNNTREVMIGGGYMSYSSGITSDRIVAVDTQPAADQSKAQKGFVIYRITPVSPLKVGEYAVVLYTGEMQRLVATWFTGTGNSYFDFGVDP